MSAQKHLSVSQTAIKDNLIISVFALGDKYVIIAITNCLEIMLIFVASLVVSSPAHLYVLLADYAIKTFETSLTVS